jgi:chorismate mutase
MTNPESSTRIVAALRELIVALDRRVPYVERIGEIQIAKDAAMLRSAALRRVEELTHAGSDQQYDKELVEAIMTDDGAVVDRP